MAQFISIEILERFCQSHPNSLANAHLASLLLKWNDHARAVEICQTLVDKHPKYAFGHFILGLAHYGLNNYTDAKRELEISLAYDSANPRAWKILSQINEQLNLKMAIRDSQLRHYLSDIFNEDAAKRYFQADMISLMDSDEGEIEEETKIEFEEETSSEMSEQEIDDLIETAVTSEEDEKDVEETIDEVFKETFPDIAETEPEDEEEETELEDLGMEEDEEPSFVDQYESEEGEEKSETTDEEISSAIDSYLSDYESELESEETEQKKSEETDMESEIDQESEKEDISGEQEFPEEFIEDEEEPMDYSAVVSDLISDREGSIEENEEEQKRDEDKDQMESKPSPEQLDSSKGEEQMGQEEEQSKSQVDSSEKASERKETTHFGRPPILSPTLGEIYLAQGRFEEAVDVFQKLLEKDPENSRYKRKIEDLKAIIAKHQSEE